MFYVLFSVQVVICVFTQFFLFNLSIFYKLFLCINNMIILTSFRHRVDVIIWVFKADWVRFWTRARMFSSRKTYFFGCIYVFIKVLWLWSTFVIVLKELFSGCPFFKYNGPLKRKCSSFPSCCIKCFLKPLLLSPHPIQTYFRYDIGEFDNISAWK